MNKKLTTFALAALLLGSGTPTMPGPAPARYQREDRQARNAACVRCHDREGTEHAAGLHARSFSDLSFQKGYRAEPQAFCRGCHAPEGSPASEPDTFAATHGVTCVTCHWPKDSAGVLSSRAGGRAPHPVVVVADFGTRACTSCHEFAFPGAAASAPERWMQKTAREHRSSPEATRACADCHMPRDRDGHTRHALRGARDDGMLRGAVTVAVRRDPPGHLTFELTPRNAGHAVPTGDLFRRLVLRVEGPFGRKEQIMTRTFTTTAGGERIEQSDDRLHSPRRIEVDVDPAAAARWSLVHQRITGVMSVPPFAPAIEEERTLAAGAIEADGAPARSRPAEGER